MTAAAVRATIARRTMTVAPTPSTHRRTRAGWVVALILAITLIVQSAVLDGAWTPDRDAGSGKVAAQTRDVPAFSRVDLAGSNRVTVRAGETQSVVVRGDDNLLGHVTTSVRGGTLMIDPVGDSRTKAPMRVEVGVPSLEALTLSGSGILVAENVHGRRLTVALPGSGVMHVSGSVTQLAVTLAGSGDAQLQRLVARDARATIEGSGRIAVHVARSLTASVSGSGAVMYSGHPARVTSNVTGSGAVIPG
jgi:hypothetical protein